MTKKEIERIAQLDVQAFIFKNEKTDVTHYLLSEKNSLDIAAPLIANQLIGRAKAGKKIPTYYKTSGIVYPPALNIEQSSSEATARFKSAWVAKEITHLHRAADLTGGFGIDSFFLSECFRQFIYVEPDEHLFQLAKHNHRQLGNKNIDHLQTSAENFLQQNESHFDLVYLDPSRRNHQSKKVFRLADCEPNVIDLQLKLFEHTTTILLKASPLFDLQKGIGELPFVKKIAVVSVNNECRELLFFQEKNFIGEPIIEAVNLTQKKRQVFSFTFHEEKNATPSFGEPEKYLYEPNASLLKSGGFKLISERLDLKKIQVNTHLYTASKKTKNFPGKIYEIEKEKFDPKTDLPSGKANVIVRNYPLSPDELKKKLKLKDGGEKFVIAFSGQTKKYIVLATRVE